LAIRRSAGTLAPRRSTLIKDIGVNLAGLETHDFAVDYAVSVAAAFGAHITGCAFLYDPVVADGMLGGVPVELIELQREESGKIARAAVERFAAAAKSGGVFAEHRILDSTIGGAAATFGRLARRFDLVVAGQGEPEQGASRNVMIEAALFESGRPLLIVPYIQRSAFEAGRVLVCWDGGRTAARAIGDALPFLIRARAVDILIVAEERKDDELAGSDMGAHLARHGVKSEVRRIVRGDIAIEEAILSYAADSSADLMVMGGYGHSRLREFILGGVTCGILQSMTLPVLMSH
jgi:nucleotide-binding universal stress UspA family protein